VNNKKKIEIENKNLGIEKTVIGFIIEVRSPIREFCGKGKV